jgi:hypothetical protein
MVDGVEKNGNEYMQPEPSASILGQPPYATIDNPGALMLQQRPMYFYYCTARKAAAAEMFAENDADKLWSHQIAALEQSEVDQLANSEYEVMKATLSSENIDMCFALEQAR